MTEPRTAKSDAFPTDPAGLPLATKPDVVDITPGGSFDLRVRPIAKEIDDGVFRMLSYNGSIPGPTLRVIQGSTVSVEVSNETHMDTTVHWHGLRLENRYDGVPHETQAPVPPGGRFVHHLSFPDAGLFWYHPHMREDYAQEMGLYGNIVVEPTDPSYWPPVDREVALTLDDILIEDGQITPFDPHESNFTAMGRFGNVLLIQGETRHDVTVQRGEVVRFLLTNTANTRVFRFRPSGQRMKLVGSDGGRYELETWVEDVIVAPSERAIVDVRFDDVGTVDLLHVTPGKDYLIGRVTVDEPSVSRSGSDHFDELRVSDEMVAERERIASFLDVLPDKTLALVAEMDFEEAEGVVIYTCPMHPEVITEEPGKCPKCLMKLMPRTAPGVKYICPMHPDVIADEPGKCPKCLMKLMPAKEGAVVGHASHKHDHAEGIEGGIEWEDLMFEVNRTTNPTNMRWKLVDRESGNENAAIDWTFDAGDQIKIRIVNEVDSDHPMHHPFHIHGQRFLVLTRDGVPESNLVWKDTVLIPMGQTVDILLDASNPGLWMAHCHIAEHMEAGMMFSFRVRAGSN